MPLWIGTSGFQYPEWKCGFYPEQMPASQMLPYYAERFATTEINYSFRRIPSAPTIARWATAHVLSKSRPGGSVARVRASFVLASSQHPT